MKTTIALLTYIVLFFVACSSAKTHTAGTNTTVNDVTKDWKFGVALWTFHTVNFPDALAKVDSAGLKYIEPNTFQKSGPDLQVPGQYLSIQFPFQYFSDPGLAALTDSGSQTGRVHTPSARLA